MREHAVSDLGRGQPEMVVEVGGRSGSAEAINADAQAMQPGVALPAKGRPGLDRHPQYLAVRDVGQDFLLIAVRLQVEQFSARHGNDVGSDPLFLEIGSDLDSDLN